MKPLIRIREIGSEDLEEDFDSVTRNYVPVKIRDLFPETRLTFDIYFPAIKQPEGVIHLKKILAEGEVYSQRLHDDSFSQGIDVFFISKEQEESFFEYLDQNVKKMIHGMNMSSEQKAQLLYDNAVNIIKKVFRERPSRSNLTLGRELVENIAIHVSLDAISAEALLGIFSKDYYTFTHCVQVAILGMSFCSYLGWSKDNIVDFGIGALFHDVGKTHIEDEILNKRGRLSKEEFDLVRKHPVLGYQQLRKTQIMSRHQLNVVLHHHEAMDGSGYPQGLKEEQIHRYARVARIIDVYDALTTRRSYKDALPSSNALEIMAYEMGSTFDNRLLNAFTTFLKGEKDSRSEPQPIDRPGSYQGNRLCIELGNRVLIRLNDGDIDLKTTLVGMESGEYLILRVPQMIPAQGYFENGQEILARYTYFNAIYQFRTIVLGGIPQPVRLLLLAYPTNVEALDLRKDMRTDCLLKAKAKIMGCHYSGIILNISASGCRIVLKLSESGSFNNLGIGQEIGILPEVPGEKNIPPFSGTVRTIGLEDGKGILGVQFTGVNHKDIMNLRKCIESIHLPEAKDMDRHLPFSTGYSYPRSDSD